MLSWLKTAADNVRSAMETLGSTHRHQRRPILLEVKNPLPARYAPACQCGKRDSRQLAQAQAAGANRAGWPGDPGPGDGCRCGGFPGGLGSSTCMMRNTVQRQVVDFLRDNRGAFHCDRCIALVVGSSVQAVNVIVNTLVTGRGYRRVSMQCEGCWNRIPRVTRCTAKLPIRRRRQP